MSSSNVAQDNSGIDRSTHDVVAIGDQHTFGIPKNLPTETRDGLASDIWNTLGREVKAAGSSIASLPSSLYHAASDPETAEESQRFGKGFENNIGPTGRIIDRTLVHPVVNAIEDYRDGKIGIDQILQYLPEALGGSAAAVVGGRVAGDVVGAVKPAPKVATPVTSESGISTPRMQARQGFAQGSSLRTQVPEAPLNAVQRSAASYLAKNKFDVPDVELIDPRNPVEDSHAINIGGRTQQVRGAQSQGVADITDQNAAAQKVLDDIQREHLKATDPVERLHAIRQKLGIQKPTSEAIGASSVAGVTPDTIARLQTRANTKGTLVSEPSENGLYTRHSVNLTTAGKPSGSIVAIEDPSEPNVLRIESADSTQGNNTGRDFGYAKLLDESQKMATERQQPVTVHVGSVQSAPAKATWRALEKQGYDVKWSDEGPSVTFKPQAKPAVKLPADIFEGITGKKPAISTPSLIETYHGMVNRALTPESIDIADHEWQQ